MHDTYIGRHSQARGNDYIGKRGAVYCCHIICNLCLFAAISKLPALLVLVHKHKRPGRRLTWLKDRPCHNAALHLGGLLPPLQVNQSMTLEGELVYIKNEDGKHL